MTTEVEDEIEKPGFMDRVRGIHLGVKLILCGGAYFACFVLLVSIVFPALLEYGALRATGTYTATWEKIYGRQGNDEGSGVVLTEDGGFLVVGFSDVNPDQSGENESVYVLKIDADGEKVWEKTYGRGSACRVIAADDGTYLVRGAKGNDLFLMKIDPEGNVVWENTYPTENLSTASGIIGAGDGSSIIVGSTSDRHELDYDIFAWKVDRDGNLVWERTYGGAGGDLCQGIARTRDGNFILAGVTGSYGPVGYNIYLLKINGTGSILWEKTIDTAYPDWGWNFKVSRIIQGSDEGFLIAGWTGYRGAGRLDILLTKVDDEGNMVWQRTYGTSGDERPFDVAASQDGGFMVAAYHKPKPPETPTKRGKADVYLFKIDADGEVTWDHRYGGEYDDYALSITSDGVGGFVVAGATAHQADYHPEAQEDDLYLIRLSPIYSDSTKTTDDHVEETDNSTDPQDDTKPPGEQDQIEEPDNFPSPGSVLVAQGWFPELSIINDGYAVLLTTDESIEISYSSDGIQWSDPILVADAFQPGIGPMASLTIRQDNTYLVVYATEVKQGGFRIPRFFATTSSDGVEWSEPEELPGSRTIPIFHQILGISITETEVGELVLAFAADFLGPDGEVYGCDGEDYGTDRTEIFIMISGDGEEWSSPVLLNNTAGRPIRGAGPLTLLEKEGILTLAHTDLTATLKWLNNSGIYVATKHSSGWIDQQIVSEDLMICGIEAYMAHLENGTTIVAFNSKSWIHIISTNDLKNWRNPVRIMEGMSPSVIHLHGDSFMMAYVQDGNIYTVWLGEPYWTPWMGDDPE